MDGEEKAETPVRRRSTTPRPAATRPPTRSSGGRMAMLFAVLAVLGGVAAWPSIQSFLDASFFAKVPILQSLQLRTSPSGLANGPTVEGSEGFPQSIAPNGAPLPVRVEILERRMSIAEDALRMTSGDRPGNASLQRLAEELLRLRHDVDGLQRQGDASPSEPSGRRSTDKKDRASLFLLSIGHLREAVDRGAPYEAEIQGTIAIAAAMASTAAVDSGLIQRLEILKSNAPTGVETRPSLALRYREISNAALREAAVSESDPMLAQVLRWTRSIINVRRAENGADPQAEATSAAIVKAGKLAAQGDLNTAVSVLQPLQGPSSDALAPWLKAASSRIAVDAALSALSAAALARTAVGEDAP